MDRQKCLYILELNSDATPEQIKAAYRELAKVWHPDRFTHDPKLQHRAQEKTKQLNLAYEWLSQHPNNTADSLPQDLQPPPTKQTEQHRRRNESYTSKPGDTGNANKLGCGCLIPGSIMMLIGIADMIQGATPSDWQTSLTVGVVLIIAATFVLNRKR